MEELQITQVWMFGVVFMMLVFVGFSVVGYFVKKERDKEK